MCLGDPLAYRQSKSKPSSFRHSRPHAVRSPESLEDVRNVSRGNSNPRITHRERHVIWMNPKPDIDFPACRRVLDRVRDEIEKQLAQTSAVSHYGHIGSERKIHCDA